VPYDVDGVTYRLVPAIESGRDQRCERALWAKIVLPVVLPLAIVADAVTSPLQLLAGLSIH